MNQAGLREIASLLKDRNRIDAAISNVIGKPMTSGHLGEWIASQIFDVTLEARANARAIDGHFNRGELDGRTVNVKWYLKREGILDMSTGLQPDFYLVLVGPKSAATAKLTRPWRIDAVHLIDTADLLKELVAAGRRVGVASSIRNDVWARSEIFPVENPSLFTLSEDKRAALREFALD